MVRTFVSLLAVAISAGVGLPALAQDSRMMQEMLRKKYEIEQQRADAETRRAQAAADASRPQPATRSRSTPTPHALAEGDPLEGTDAQKCTLNSGTTIRVSGTFRPSSSVKCQKPDSTAEVEPADQPE